MLFPYSYQFFVPVRVGLRTIPVAHILLDFSPSRREQEKKCFHIKPPCCGLEARRASRDEKSRSTLQSSIAHLHCSFSVRGTVMSSGHFKKNLNAFKPSEHPPIKLSKHLLYVGTLLAVGTKTLHGHQKGSSMESHR